jgi:hypothetical protein
LLLPVIAIGTVAPYRLKICSCGLPGLSRQQKESKRCAVLFSFQGTARFSEIGENGEKNLSPHVVGCEKPFFIPLCVIFLILGIFLLMFLKYPLKLSKVRL